MNIVFQKKLADGRTIIVYNDKTEQNNFIALVKRDGIKPDLIIPLREQEDRWKDELPKILGITKKELDL